MRLFPTFHATGDLPAAHQAHLERHGLTPVGRDDDPDVTLVLAGTEPGEQPTAGSGLVILLSGDHRPSVAQLLAKHGIVALAEDAAASQALVPADLGGDDLLAW